MMNLDEKFIIRDFSDAVLNTIKEYEMFSGGSVTVGLSGGADSTALLCVLNSLSESLGITLHAVHINHCLRGAESDRDEEFCRKLCEKLNLPFQAFRVDVKAECESLGVGTEEGARKIRYEIFERCEKNGTIATAHTASDAAETLMFNIARGSGLHGLRSIPPVRKNIVRPLISVTREQILQYLSAIKQDYVTDSTNLTDDYSRNKIRHNIIPVMREINPAFSDSASRLIASARDACDFIDSAADSLISSDASLNVLRTAHRAVLTRYITLRCELELGITPEYKHVMQVCRLIEEMGKSVQLPGRTHAKISGDRLVFLHDDAEKVNAVEFCEKFAAGTVRTPYKSYVIRIYERKEYDNNQKINNLLFKNSLDYDRISDSTVIRSRKPGDVVRLYNRNCSKTLKKLYCEAEIPLESRASSAIVSSDDGILWLEGFGVCENAAVRNDTRNIAVIIPQKKDISGMPQSGKGRS